VITLAFLLAVGTAPAPSSSDCNNPALIVEEHATDVVRRGCTQVEYTVKEGYPAAGLISRIEKKLVADGWKPTEAASSNPGTASGGHQWGEHHLNDAKKTRVDHWLGWYAKDKSQLQLALSFTDRPPADKSPRPLSVRITLITPETWRKSPAVKVQPGKTQ
jgi:hypothetical protein